MSDPVVQEERLKVEKATIADVPQMHKLINYFADKGEMLPRPLSELYENIRDFFVVKNRGELLACVSFHVTWSDLAEVKACAVAEDWQDRGVGAMLVEACLEDAKSLGIPKVFCLTYQPAFFEKFGFRQVDVMSLPRKVWTECYHCPKFPNCDEVALTYEFPETDSKDGSD